MELNSKCIPTVKNLFKRVKQTKNVRIRNINVKSSVSSSHYASVTESQILRGESKLLIWSGPLIMYWIYALGTFVCTTLRFFMVFWTRLMYTSALKWYRQGVYRTVILLFKLSVTYSPLGTRKGLRPAVGRIYDGCARRGSQ